MSWRPFRSKTHFVFLKDRGKLLDCILVVKKKVVTNNLFYKTFTLRKNTNHGNALLF